MKETSVFDPDTETFTVKYSGDSQQAIDDNAAARNSKTSFDQFKPNKAGLVHVGAVTEEFIMQMRLGQCCPDGTKYDLLAADRDELKRALRHVQDCHPYFLTVDKKPFAKKRLIWN